MYVIKLFFLSTLIVLLEIVSYDVISVRKIVILRIFYLKKYWSLSKEEKKTANFIIKFS